MFCAPDEGAAAVVMCRADIAHRYTVDTDLLCGPTAIRTRRYGAFEVHATWAAGRGGRRRRPSARREAAYELAGIGPEDVDVIQLQDTDAGAEVIHMAENGFCADGEQEQLLADGATEIDGPLPVNTDGGLIANGEPIGASGLRQVHELVLQLRGRPATARCRATRRWATPSSTARRGPPACRSSTWRPDRPGGNGVRVSGSLVSHYGALRSRGKGARVAEYKYVTYETLDEGAWPGSC